MYSKRFATQLALAVIAVATLLGSAWAQNLVYNGSFEEPAHSGYYVTYFAGATFGGWRVTQGSIDLKRFDGTPPEVGPAYDGFQFVDLNGTPGVGGIAQDVSIPTSGWYRLQFAMSANNYYAPQDAPRTMRVSLGNLYSGSFSFDPKAHPGHGPTSYAWDVYAIDVLVPQPGTYTLSFVSTFTLELYTGPTVDAVSLTPVPEPASVAALATGLVGLVTLRRRKR